MKNTCVTRMIRIIMVCLNLFGFGCFKVAFGQTGTFTDPRDDQEYAWVKIGNQTWMAENLRYLPMVTGPGAESESIPYYYVYAYNGNSVDAAKYTDNYRNYGVLYNWPAAMDVGLSENVSSGSTQGACPPGWHLPGEGDWDRLVNFLVTKYGLKNSRENVNGVGNKLKSCRQLDSPLGGICNTPDHPRWASHKTHYGTDEFGFAALPGGYRYAGGNMGNIGYRGYWWTSAEDSPEEAWRRDINNIYGSVDSGVCSKAAGFSVRCVKDE